MKYFYYKQIIVDRQLNGPDGFLPVNTTSSIFFNNNFICASEIKNLNEIYLFNPIETTKEIFDEAYSAYMSDKTGSI